MTRPETPRKTFWSSIGRLAVATAFAILFLTVSSQEALAQVAIQGSAFAGTAASEVTLSFRQTVTSTDANTFLIVMVAVGKSQGTITPITGTYDPDGAGGTAPIALTSLGTFYEGASTTALRSVTILYLQNPPVTTTAGNTITLSNANTPQGLRMLAYSYVVTNVFASNPFNYICTDTDIAGTPQASCTVNTIASNGLVIDALSQDSGFTIDGETPSGKGGLARQQESLGGAGQKIRGTSGAFIATSNSVVTGYTTLASNSFIFVAIGVTPANITKADVSFFDATRFTETMRGQATDRGVLLRWRTSAEKDNVGFYIYRENLDGSRVRVTPDLVAGSTLMSRAALLAGYGYAWWDAEGTDSNQYWIETIDTSGKSELKGPFRPSVKEGAAPGAAASSQTLARMNADVLEHTTVTGAPAGYGLTRGKPSGGSNAPGAGAAQLQLASSAAVKLSVAERGWYRVTQDSLAALGWSPTKVDARNLQLYVNGNEIAMRVTGESDGRFDPGDAIEFFGAGLDTPSTDTQVYWLTAGATRGKRIKLDSASPSNGSPVTFPYVVEQKGRSIYIGNVNNGERENFFGQVIFSSLDTNLPLNNVAAFGTTAQVSVGVQGFYETAHEIEVSLNGQVLGVINGEGSTHATATYTVPHALLHEGNNVVTLRRVGSATVHLVDYVRITYQRTSIATANELLLSNPTRQPAITVGGFTTQNIRVVDVTNASNVLEYTTRVAGSGTNYTATVRGQVGRVLYAFAGDVVKQPAAIEIDQPSSWNLTTNRADVVMISHGDFIGELGALKALRESQGYTVAVVDVEDIYDEFSFGIHNPAAIRAFLARTASWQTAPAYVLLVGDATYDPRNYLGIGYVDFVPTRLVDTIDYQAAYDDWLADRNGDDVAELAIGRLPVRTVSEAQAVIGKILAHEAAATGTLSAVFVADSPSGDDFVENSEAVQALVPSSVAIQQIYRAQAGSNARQLTLDAINAGPSIVHYSGHGSTNVWAGNILMDTDAPSLTNANRFSVFTVSNCLNAYFHASVGDSLGEALLKAPNGGAIAVWASSGTTPSTNQQPAALDFYVYLFSSPNATVGQAAVNAKRAATLDVRQSWVLLGDPLTRLK